MRLENKTRNSLIISELKEAKTFWTRTRGLLGLDQISEDEGLLIHRCNSIHTFFMNFPIDCIFIDSELKVKKTYQNIKPWKMTIPVLGASSVIELKAGRLKNVEVQIGDQLYVGT